MAQHSQVRPILRRSTQVFAFESDRRDTSAAARNDTAADSIAIQSIVQRRQSPIPQRSNMRAVELGRFESLSDTCCPGRPARSRTEELHAQRSMSDEVQPEATAATSVCTIAWILP